MKINRPPPNIIRYLFQRRCPLGKRNRQLIGATSLEVGADTKTINQESNNIG